MKTLILLSIVIASQVSSAMPPLMEQLYKAVPEAKGVSCTTCHTQAGGTETNAFGRDFLQVAARAQFTQEAWEQLLAMDSDNDGISNYLELMQGTNPGVAQ